MSVRLYGGNQYLDLKWWTFPGGERNVQISSCDSIEKFKSFTVVVDFKKSDDMIDMLLLVNACRNVSRNVKLRLRIPYFPAARQDRVMNEGEPFALQVMANLIKSCDFTEVEVWDPHSDVLAGMFDPGVLLVKPQWELAHKMISAAGYSNYALVSPDAGALKKIYKLAKLLEVPVVEAMKERDVTNGKIVQTNIPVLGHYETYIVVDDICDGGFTFIELAKVLKAKKPNAKLVLYITHGIFSKGRDVLNEWYDDILCVNEMDK